MKEIKRKLIAFLCTHSKRYKLHRICKALEIKPYSWQRDFALDQISYIPSLGRCTGKTMAVMLRLLMINPEKRNGTIVANTVLEKDIDFHTRNARWCKWYANEYKRLSQLCTAAGIPVLPYSRENGADGYKINFVYIDENHHKRAHLI